MSQAGWDAQAYETVASPQRAWGRRLIASRSWRGDEAVLDAGCGPGTLTLELLERVPRGRVVAVDDDDAMVARASENLAKHGPRVRVLKQDVQHLSIDDSFDVVFSNAVLHWVADHDAAFETFLRHLRPGGELLLQCGGEGNLERVRGIAAQVLRAEPFAAHFKDWTPPWHYEDDASTQERLLIAGFVNPQVTLEAMPTRFDDAASLRGFAETVLLRPYLQRIPTPDERQRFVDDFMRRIGSRPEAWTLDYVRLNVRAQRAPHH